MIHTLSYSTSLSDRSGRRLAAREAERLNYKYDSLYSKCAYEGRITLHGSPCRGMAVSCKHHRKLKTQQLQDRILERYSPFSSLSVSGERAPLGRAGTALSEAGAASILVASVAP